MLQQEKEASKRKGSKRNLEEDMDVPVAAGSCEKDDKSKEKKEQQELRKRIRCTTER